MASITKTATGYRARYRTPTGASRSKTFGKKVDAERWVTSTEHSKLSGAYIDPQFARVRLGPYAEGWLATNVDISERTRINVEGRLRNYVLPAFGERALGAIEPAEVRRFVADLVAAGLAPSTVRATYNALAAVLRQAEADRLIVRSPCVEVQMPRDRANSEERFLEPANIAALANAVTDRYRVAVLTAAYTGLRAGELWALKTDRLDLLRGTVEVTESLSEVRGQLVTKAPKNGKRRTVALPGFLCEQIGEQIGRYPSPAGYVFTAGEGGTVRHRNFVRRHFAPAAVAAELAPLPLARSATHLCRHPDRPGAQPPRGERAARALLNPSHLRPLRAPLSGGSGTGGRVA